MLSTVSHLSDYTLIFLPLCYYDKTSELYHLFKTRWYQIANHMHFTTISGEYNIEYKHLQEFLLETLKCPITTIRVWKKKKEKNNHKGLKDSTMTFSWDCFVIVEWIWGGGRQNKKHLFRKYHGLPSFFACQRWTSALPLKSLDIPKTQSAFAVSLCETVICTTAVEKTGQAQFS